MQLLAVGLFFPVVLYKGVALRGSCCAAQRVFSSGLLRKQFMQRYSAGWYLSAALLWMCCFTGGSMADGLFRG